MNLQILNFDLKHSHVNALLHVRSLTDDQYMQATSGWDRSLDAAALAIRGCQHSKQIEKKNLKSKF
jgi:hypothetical protein